MAVCTKMGGVVYKIWGGQGRAMGWGGGIHCQSLLMTLSFIVKELLGKVSPQFAVHSLKQCAIPMAIMLFSSKF